jgi:predicted dehydrogenase
VAAKRKRLEHVNVAVIGLGIGRGHLKAYRAHPGATVRAVCDTDPARIERCRAEGTLEGVECFASTDDLFKAAEDLGLDAVSVALPNALHAPVSIAALKAGLHVLCEKPMAMNVGECRRMIAAAEERGLTLGLNLSFRFRPQSRALKDLAASGALGRVYYAHTRWFREFGLPKFGGWFGQKAMSGGGPIIDLGVHRLDLAMWLMGSPAPVTVSAATYDPIGSALAEATGKAFDVEDLGAAFVRFEGGASLVLEASWAGYIGKREDMVTEILGTEGGLVQRNTGEGYDFEAWYFGRAGGALTETRVRRRLDPTPDPYSDFVEALLEGRPTLAPAEAGLKVQMVLDGIYKSAKLGREVRLRAPR